MSHIARRAGTDRRAQRPRPEWLLCALLSAGALAVAACGGSRGLVPQGITEPDRFLFERGMEEIEGRNWMRAREYLRAIIDTYPQSPYRPDAKLAVGDSFIGEGTTESYVLGINEFREFLSFYPTHKRADYAQARLAYAHFRQMRRAERDQTETKEAIREYEVFFERYPNSSLMPEVKAQWREARDRLSDSEYHVGFFYYRTNWYPGAIDRFKGILQSDPGYTHRDAVYFHLAEALVKTDKKAEALPYYERVVAEFERSEYLEDARKRIVELKAEVTPPATHGAE